jgi:hypothetical protein
MLSSSLAQTPVHLSYLSLRLSSLCVGLPIHANGQRDGANYDDSKKVWTSYTAIPLRSKRYADRKSLDNVVIFMVTRRTGYGGKSVANPRVYDDSCTHGSYKLCKVH